MSTIPHDVIDHLAGIAPADYLGTIRQVRATAREQAQLSFVNLFDAAAASESHFTQQDRLLVAVYVTKLHQQDDIAGFYSSLLAPTAANHLAAVHNAAASSLTEGPYGNYPAGPLSTENVSGIRYTPDAATVDVLGAPLSAALAHAHLLVFHPRDASPDALQQLLEAGWQTREIVTLSQLISFLAFQIRVVIGLRVLAVATPSAAA